MRWNHDSIALLADTPYSARLFANISDVAWTQEQLIETIQSTEEEAR